MARKAVGTLVIGGVEYMKAGPAAAFLGISKYRMTQWLRPESAYYLPHYLTTQDPSAKLLKVSDLEARKVKHQQEVIPARPKHAAA